MLKFKDENLLVILKILESKLIDNGVVKFSVLNPDICKKCYAGEKILIDNQVYIYRSYKNWQNLAEALGAKFLTPTKINNYLVELNFKKLNTQNSFHSAKVIDIKEKYGIESEFFKINKNEEASFLIAFKRALEFADIKNRNSILNLGINRADEFDLILNLVGKECFESKELVGVDFSKSAIEYAKKRFSTAKFYTKDINEIDSLNLGKFDLIVSIGTLQSPSINYKPFLMKLNQEYLKEGGAFILGFPNSRWIDGELTYGARVKNYSFSEMSLLFEDVIFAKKYLQQKKFKVIISGKEYIFLTAIKN